jgi:NADH-quinone oxidoreductase subunit M
MFSHVLLSLLIWIPVLGGFLVLSTGNDKNAKLAQGIAVVTALICLGLSFPLYFMFDSSSYAMQFQEHMAWIPTFNINYSLGVDGISMPMILLTNFTSLLVIIAAIPAIRKKVSQYLGAFLIMQGTMVGVFAATDAMLFYVFWEAMLIPMYICIGVWGGKNRSYASIKFFIYTFVGSALMLIALLYLRVDSGSFSIASFYKLHMPMAVQILIFLAFFAAFAVKVPMWPFHTWLPDAHTEAPAGGSVVLAALMLKMGIYGFIRFSMPITPDASQTLSWLMIILGLIAVVYVAYIAIVQTDMKRLIAYSSISHMGFAVLGCFLVYTIINTTGNYQDAYMSVEGAMVQMISHAFGSGAMFLGVGILFDQLGSRFIKDYGGVAKIMPVFAAFFMLFAMSNVGLPGTSGFVGEFMIILSAFQASFWVALLAGTTLVFGAAYTLWMYMRVFFRPVAEGNGVASLKDISGANLIVFTLLAIGVVWIGVYPEWLLRVLHASVGHLLHLSLQHRL